MTYSSATRLSLFAFEGPYIKVLRSFSVRLFTPNVVQRALFTLESLHVIMDRLDALWVAQTSLSSSYICKKFVCINK